MSDRAVLLSVSPEFAEKIIAGTKTVEIRRRFPAVPVGTWLYFYVTLPVGKIGGRAKVVDVDVAPPARLWENHHAKVGITRARFDQYFGSRPSGVAVCIEAYETLESISLERLRIAFPGFTVPQSFRYLDAHEQLFILNETGLEKRQ